MADRMCQTVHLQWDFRLAIISLTEVTTEVKMKQSRIATVRIMTYAHSVFLSGIRDSLRSHDELLSFIEYTNLNKLAI